MMTGLLLAAALCAANLEESIVVEGVLLHRGSDDAGLLVETAGRDQEWVWVADGPRKTQVYLRDRAGFYQFVQSGKLPIGCWLRVVRNLDGAAFTVHAEVLKKPR